MNTAQITHALEGDPTTNKKFCGVFPRDKLPQTIDKYPCGFVANTDPEAWNSLDFNLRLLARVRGSIHTTIQQNFTGPPCS